jgi:serine/threonine-protein kinase HipA
LVDDAYQVFLYDQPVGVLERTERGVALVFEPSYREQVPRPVLGQWFLDRDLEKRIRFSALPPWFANLLPEGWLRAYVGGVLPEGSDDLSLLNELGLDLPGAVTVSPLSGGRSAVVRGEIELPAEEAADTASASDILRFSLSGVQPKLSVDRDDRVTMPVGGRNGRWILKLPDNTHPALPEIEYIVMTWAASCGLNVPSIDLVSLSDVVGMPSSIRVDGARGFLCKRFDRLDDGRRVHQEDLAQVFGVRPTEKYGEKIGASYVQIGRLLRQIAGVETAYAFVRRLAFDVICGNGDGHLKNWSLTYPDGRSPELAPCYDIVSTVLYPQYPRSLALSLLGITRMESVTSGTFREFGKKIGISPDDSEAIAVETARRAVSTLEDILVPAELVDQKKAELREHVAAMRLAK